MKSKCRKLRIEFRTDLPRYDQVVIKANGTPVACDELSEDEWRLLAQMWDDMSDFTAQMIQAWKPREEIDDDIL